MGIYYFIIGLLLFECLIFNNNRPNQQSKKFSFFMTLLFLALVAGCRSLDVGHDTYNYCNIFERIGSMSLRSLLGVNTYSTMEQGYVWLCWLFYRVSSNYSHFLIVIALFEFSAVGSWIWKNTTRPFIALLIFVCLFYTFFLTGIRQSLALCILLHAYEDVNNNRPIWFVVKVLIAMLFHFSALIFFPIYLISKMFRGCGKMFVIMVTMLPVLYVTRVQLYPFLVGIFDRYSDWRIGDHADPVTFTVLLVMIVCVSVFMLYTSPIPNPVERKRYCDYTNYIMVAVLVMPFVGLVGSLLRVAMYYNLFVCLQIEKIYGRFKERNMRITAVLVSLSLLVVLFLLELQGSAYLYEFIGFENLFYR